jgi:DNA end-binding protein Ku
MWNGTLSFGLVNLSVGMYPATRENQIHFHLLHKKDCGRIKNQRVCTVCGEVLDYDELVKGYEYQKGDYVTITDEDMKKARPESTETIAIQGFVDLDEIDPIFFDSPYYLVPANKSDRIYLLLRQALEKTGKVGIASFVLRTKEYLAVIRPYGEALLLNTMHFADEVRGAEDMPSPVEIPAKELDMAVQLVEAMGEEFDPSQYKNNYNEALRSVIERKLAGKKVETKVAPKEPTKVTDLMARLKASLESSPSAAKKPARTAAAKKTATTKPKAPAAKTTATKKPKLKLVA